MKYMYIGRAWTWQRKGEPLELELTVQNVPEPGPDEVLVKNRVVGLNPVDWQIVEWVHPEWRAGHVPGVDGAGTIVSVGRNVSLKIGENVAYHQDITRCGSFAAYTCGGVKVIIPGAAHHSF